MKVENLVAFLYGTSDLASLQKEIASEVQESARLSRIEGSSIPIAVDEVFGVSYPIRPEEVRRLCEAFVDGCLSTDELAYISDAMQLSDAIDWLNDELFDMVFQMSDPEINGPFTIEAGRALLARLGAS